MQVINKSKKQILHKKAAFLTGAAKLQGLIGKSPKEAVVFKTRWGIHTFGMNFPIDVLVLNNTKVVVLAKTLRPNRMLFWNPIYSLVIELPYGTIKRSKTKTGDTMNFQGGSI